MQGANVAAARAGGSDRRAGRREQPRPACHDNILPLEDASAAHHPAAHFPEVAAALAGLRDVGGLRWPDAAHDRPGADIFEWLQAWFGFQEGSVRNQREHLLLMLANTQMRLQPAGRAAGPEDEGGGVALDEGVVHAVFKRVTGNYQSYCSFLRKVHSLGLAGENTRRKELLYTSLYLLIWGEAANLRFLPECLCYIFHHMAEEMNYLLADAPALAARGPAYPRSPYGFLDNVVTPIYKVLKAESDSNRGGRLPHSAWRNYDDFNEYFWNPDCFAKLGWPMKLDSAFFVEPGAGRARVGKTGFVEQRSFLHLFRSFDRHWVLLILAFQAMVIIAWSTDGKAMWREVQSQDVVARLLTCFITWAALRLAVACTDIVLHWRLAARETPLVGLRMALKAAVACTWIILFSIFYSLMVLRRDKDGHWSAAAQSRFRALLLAAAIFLIPQALGLLMFLLPPLSRAFETRNWLVLRPVTWWFRSHLFVGRGLRESFYDTTKYLLFWILLLGAKFTFSYYLQIQPLVHPTKQILELQGIKYKWHQFSKDHNYTAVVAIWAPVTLVYLMDVQIWYSVLSSIVGALVGVFSHIGEVHNVKFLIMRFQSLPRAVMFNLLAPEAQAGSRHTWSLSRWTAPVRRWFEALGVRYAHVLGIRPQAADAGKTHLRFAQIWNEIMASFREEDLLSNREEELLRVPTSTWRFTVPQWPSVLISNELLVALDRAKQWERSSSPRLWHWVRGSEFRRCAVVEAYESLKHVLQRVVAADRERIMVQRMLEVVDAAATTAAGRRRTEHDFVTSFRLAALPAVHAKATALVEALLKRPGPQEAPQIVSALQALHEAVVHDFMSPETVELLRHDGVFPPPASEPLYWDCLELPESDEAYFRQLRRLHTMLTTVDPMFSIPKNLEARRRIAFFCNSMFEDMPQAPEVEAMRSFSVLTPYYKETVNFSKKELQEENDDGISILYYLQKIYPDEWDNFVERVGGTEKQLWQTDEARQLRTWASFRGQTLARCVRGMMYYRRALELLALLDSSTAEGEGFQELVEATSSATASAAAGLASRSRSAAAGPTRHVAAQTSAIADIKFTYVVSCQMYGDQKAKREPQAQEILELMREYEALRVAFEDQRPAADGGGGGVDHFSVLVKCDHTTGIEQEIYRIKLPGPMKVGEGKPENQNHAIVFTRGDALQTIDMNQDNYLEEALKMRNLLSEFGRRHGGRPPTLLGVREHVFTGSVSSLASFMSAQEMAFVTLGQRVLANPLRVRMHYGHPDVFDRLWFITRGGISKASKTINISEDIYAGFNCTLRGGSVSHHEYIQVGKGRDVGLNQIALFEGKVASGNGEQVLSRDVYRLGHRLDPFRSLSFYYTSVGFYAATMLTVLTVYAFLWGRCYLALSGIETAVNSATNVFKDKALNTALNQQFIVQLGVFTALPLVVELTLEKGLAAALWEFVLMQLQLASLFFTFSLGTRTHYFGRTILHGGAKYRSTGRGFVVRREKFPEIFRMYAHSHFVKAAELLALLVVYMTYTALPNSTLYFLITLSAWTLALTWLTAPFIFNPSGFDWVKAVEDYREFVEWLWFKEGLLASEARCWEVWWLAEIEHLSTTGAWGLIAEAVLSLRFLFFQYGIVYHLKIASNNTSLLVYLVSWVSVVVALLAYIALSMGTTKYGSTQHLKYRGIQCAVLVVFVTLLGLGLGFTKFGITDLLLSSLAFVPTGWALLQLSLVAHACFPSRELATQKKGTERWTWNMTVEVARLYYGVLGTVAWLPMAVLSWLPGLQDMQTRILFNQAFSRGLQISRIVNGKRPNAGS